MDKRYAIFDMDGTLVDSMVFWKNLASEYLKSKGVTEIPDDILKKIKAMTMTESAAVFVKEFHLEGSPEQVAEEMNAMMDQHYQKDIPLKNSVQNYLEQLHCAGTVLCVASATAEHLMEACLKRLGVAHYFQFLLSCETVGAGKIKPDVYFASAERLGARPEEIAVYEDALYAARTAKEAGFYVVGVYDDSASGHWDQLKALSDEWIDEW